MSENRRWTRRQFLGAAGAAAGTAVAAAGLADCSWAHAAQRLARAPGYRTRPDLKPPSLAVTRMTAASTAGLLFLTPNGGGVQSGPMIADSDGSLVWFRPLEGTSTANLRVQQYLGAPVLTWWEGQVTNGHGTGEHVLLDRSYREVARVRAGGAYQADLHEFVITPAGTALLAAYHEVPADLTPVGGSNTGSALDSVIQEVDVATGQVVLEWHSLDHVALDESYTALPAAGQPFDYFHINSIDVDADGHLLVSARNTWAVYKIDRSSGEVMWRLGGKRSDFAMAKTTRFAWQHDARRQPDGTLTLFDDGAVPQVEARSRGLVLKLDETRMTSTVARQYTHVRLLSGSQGNMQILANDHALVGWGSQPYVSEFTRGGELIFDARFVPAVQSYRAYRSPWSGQPADRPTVSVDGGASTSALVHASWNGATDVAVWEVLSGSPPRMRPVRNAPRRGFETAIPVPGGEPYIAVRANDSSGRTLGESLPVAL